MPVVNPGIRRYIGSAIQRLFNSASFSAPLTHSLTLERGTGSPTFTRATTAAVQDHEGVLRTVPSGCARFQGGRMVRNWIQSPTENWSSAAWGKVNVAVSGTQLTATAANAVIYDTAALGIGSNRTAVASVTLTRVTGTGDVSISTNGGTTYTAVTVNGSRASVTLTGNINGQFAIKIHTSGDVIEATYPQLEDVTGQADQTASEYVSVGVLSAPYHGAGADGVKYFDTDLSGNPIAASTLKGYLAEPAATNLCLQSNAFTTTWTASGTPTITQNVVGPDGATSAWTLTDGAGGADHIISGNITFTAAAYTASVFIKKTVGATTFPVLWMIDAGSTTISLCTADTNNGVATVWTANGFGLAMMAGASARCSSYNDNYWRFELTATGTAVAYNFKFGPALTTTANQSSGTFSGATTGSAVFYGAQLELGTAATSYIATTTVAVARNADVLTYPSAGNVSGTAGWISCEYSVPAFYAGTNFRSLQVDDGTENNRIQFAYDAAGTNQNFAVVVSSAAQAVITGSRNITSKVAGSYSANSFLAAFNGTAGTPDASGTVPTVTTIRIGNNASGAEYLNGTIRNVRIGQRQLSSSELQAITR